MGNNCCSKQKNHKKVVLLVLGLDNSGKTVISKGLAGEHRFAVVPTVGFSVHNLRFKNCDVHLYDLGGGKQIRGIWYQYFADAHGLIYVVDSSNYERLIESKQLLEETLSNEKLHGKPILLLANKQDCNGALDELDIVEKLKIENLVNLHRCPTLVQSCSAIENTSKSTKLDTNIVKGYTWLLNYIDEIYWKLNVRVERDISDKLKQDLIAQKRKINLQNDRRSTNCSIDWDKENDQLQQVGSITSEIETIDTMKIIEKNNSLESQDVVSIHAKPISASPHIYHEYNGELNRICNISSPNPSLTKQHKPERKYNIFSNMKSNKTAPDTLLEISSLRNSPKLKHRNGFQLDRRIRSADTSSQQVLNVHSFKIIHKSNNDITESKSELCQLNNKTRSTHSNKVLPFKNGLIKQNKTWISNKNNFDTNVFHIDVDQ